MNNRRSLMLAAILFVGAIAAGYWGLVISRQQPIAEVPVTQVVEQGVATVEDQTRHPVVVLVEVDRKSTRLNSSHYQQSRMPSSA